MMDYQYPATYSTEQNYHKRVKGTDGVYRYEVRGDVIKAKIEKGRQTIAQEDKLSKRAFARKMCELTLRQTSDTERRAQLDELFWKHIECTEKDGGTYLVYKPIETCIKTRYGYETITEHVQAQPIRLRDWWIRQLT